MKRPLLSLSVDTAADDAAEEARAARFSADMAAVDRDSFSRHLVDGVFTVKGIGQGASGVVHLACHAPTLRLLALKSVSVADEAAEAAVMLELHAEHENLVPLTATGEPMWLYHHRRSVGDVHPCPQIASFYGSYADREARRVWMALEYMDSGSLDHYCASGEQQHPGGALIAEALLLHVARECLRALAHLERHGVVHRDIKPANILVARNGDVKLGDLGLARTIGTAAASASASANPPVPPAEAAGAAGTPKMVEAGGTTAFLSPERVRGAPYGFGCDVWAMGVTLITLATGRCPIDTSNGFFGVEAQLVAAPGPLPALPQRPSARAIAGGAAAADEGYYRGGAGVSAATVALVSVMVEKDAARRPSAAALLRHEAFAALPTVAPTHAAVVGYTAAAAAGDASAAVPLATSLSHAKQAASVAVERPPQLMAAWAELLSGASAELENSPLTTPGAPQQVVAAAQEDVRMRCSPAPWR